MRFPDPYRSLLLVACAACASAGAAPQDPAGPREAAVEPAAAPVAAGADRAPHAGMMRYPAISADRIVFSYADDLWVVPRAGGVAAPLASPEGLEQYPRFSPDGETIAFVGNYDGGADLYTVPVAGGVPARVTHHPQYETLCGWTPEGRLLFHANGSAGLARQSQLYTVAPTGGLPERLPVPYGSYGALDGRGRLAYTPMDRVGRTWKRYAGGLASDLWMVDLATGASRRLTDFEGTDVFPMWHGETLYFASDAGPRHRMNLWALDLESGERRQVTEFDDDVRWPSIGPDAIVFVVGAELRVLDLATEESEVVHVRVPGARPQLRSRLVDAAEFLSEGNWHASPSGKRVAVEARGDLWTLPAKHGQPRNLTATSGVAEREPTWSPDGRWIAYMSDASGDYELHVIRSDGKGEPRRVTTDGAPFRYSLAWSPDSKRISLVVKGGHLKLVDVASGEVTHVDSDPLSQYPSTLEAVWSHDSAWLAYTRADEASRNRSIWLHEVATGVSTQVTADFFSQRSPAFDREGRYLYYVGQGNWSPTYSAVDTTWIYRENEVLHLVPLREDVPSPFLPEVDEETWEEDEEEDEEEDADAQSPEAGGDAESEADGDEGADDDDEDDGEEGSGDAEGADDIPEPLRIDLEGFERRAVRLPVPPGSFRGLAVNDAGHLLYLRMGEQGADLKLLDVTADEPEEATVLEGVGGFQLTAKGDRMLYVKGGKPFLAKAAAGAKGEPVSTEGMLVEVEPRAEWAQLLADTHRIYRDFFYVENMHGVDWDAAYADYAGRLEHAASRRDVGLLIAELISELNVGHAYTGGGDVESGPRRDVGLLGADLELHEGAYRIVRILEGAPWDSDARGPLSQPGVDVSEGDYLLAVDGRPLDPARDPWAPFVGLAGDLVTLTVSADPAGGEDEREVTVRCLRSERDLRYRAWVEGNRRRVAERSGGRVGYVYVPNTGVDGQNELVRQFHAQRGMEALVIDDRWNGGGQIPTRFIELLNRPLVNHWARRDGADWVWPYDAHLGPKCMLINGAAGSGGDAFPAYFRKAGLGKLVGMRTWGGLVGISGNPALIDGGRITVPTFGYYDPDGTWGIEGYGVPPDLEVIDDPGAMRDGGDPQLEAAVDLMLAELEERGEAPVRRPSAPDRSGMGITVEDR
jgi:tricorn protease